LGCTFTRNAIWQVAWEAYKGLQADGFLRQLEVRRMRYEDSSRHLMPSMQDV
jgi:hypothetical protein